MSTNRRRRGFSLIELIVFIVIVSIAVVGVLGTVSFATRNSADPLLRKQALAIAEGLLEEIELAYASFCDPSDPVADSAASSAACAVPEVVGQEAGTPGRPFDNVNDYVNAFDTPTTFTKDAAGADYPAGYTVRVTISPDATLGPVGAPITPADTTAANMNVLRIRVQVSYGNDSVVLDGYRTRYAPNALP